MANYRMAKKGTHFNEGSVAISWPTNWDESTVASIPKSQMTPRVHTAVANGRLVETKKKASEEVQDDLRTYKLMTGEEAKAHREIPAGPVTRRVFDPRIGDTVEVEIQTPKMTRAPAELEDDAVTDDDEEGTPPAEDAEEGAVNLEAGTDDPSAHPAVVASEGSARN